MSIIFFQIKQRIGYFSRTYTFRKTNVTYTLFINAAYSLERRIIYSFETGAKEKGIDIASRKRRKQMPLIFFPF